MRLASLVAFFPTGRSVPLTLLKYKALSNLVTWPLPAHTRITYHRTWETGLEVAARAAIADPDFFASFRPEHHIGQQFSAELRRKSPLPQRNFLQSGVHIRKSSLRKV
jgi:hypothetical protein